MCGICGEVTFNGTAAGDTLATMNAKMRARGPDAGGAFTQDRVGFGHRRLSIIDLSLGSQPMANEDETLWIVYNGEIFNHASLRPPLEAAGHRYRTHCDTETILHSFEQHGARIAFSRFFWIISTAHLPPRNSGACCGTPIRRKRRIRPISIAGSSGRRRVRWRECCSPIRRPIWWSCS